MCITLLSGVSDSFSAFVPMEQYTPLEIVIIFIYGKITIGYRYELHMYVVLDTQWHA